ncbi:hypothetical protein PVL29_001439 [Vitis rotundifolia]|uniref:Plant/T31B5-30 protein n=1 Tax=Vitis rotundifolia TaxID=103349 RepID=A0AA39ALN6_VITRO|nr:hypothetical protein PVL29_001439 [Vitis rotundifolia]
MATLSNLLGPPELRRGAGIHQPQDPPAATGDAFMDLMVANFNSARVLPKPPMGYTENASATFLSSGNPCLDFFFHVVPDTPPEVLKQRLELAWSHDPLTTLKLICNLRGVRGTGKSDKEGFYTAALWLHGLHPKTFACNVESFANFGYYKDLLEILFRLLEGPDVRRIAKSQRRMKNKKRGNCFVRKFRFGHGKLGKNKETKKGKPVLPREVRVKAEMERAKAEKETARVCRKERRLAMAKKAMERYGRDPDYRFLHDRISDLFAEHLKSDLQLLNSGNVSKISLAAKWCPSIDSSFDRSTLLCESIARKIFPKSDPEYEGVEDAHYAYRVRDRLRKQVLVPLRRALELPEVYMGANRWSELPYNRVASVAMKTYKERFIKHDEARFFEYLSSVRAGKAKIAAGALLPHEIISSLEDEDGGQVAELQWQRMVEDVSKKGKLKNCIAICDVSGSMFGIPMEVSVALGILVSELSEDPWKGKVITFSETPELHMITGEDLRSKASFVREMNWGVNTDFQKVFDLILQVAVNGKLSQDAMIKRIIVFSDMEFDQASANSWETDYEAIKRKFRDSGYETAVPEIVFWNLRDSRATPVPGTEKGVALVSGFSKNLLTLFLENGGVVNPEAVMEAAISGEEYDKLIVMD